MGVGAVSFFKIRFGIVNPELVRQQIADRVEEIAEVVDEQRRIAAENEKKRRQQEAAEMLEAASRVAAAKRAAKALRLRREQELVTRQFWLWRAWADKRIFLKRQHGDRVQPDLSQEAGRAHRGKATGGRGADALPSGE